jgi:CBS domain-containing protein
MQARDVMTTNVISIHPRATILQAIRLMLQRRISGLPVVDDGGRLVGIVTEGDFLRRAETGTQHRRPAWLEFLVGPGRMATEYVNTHARRIEQVMTPDPVTVAEDCPLETVVSTMEKRSIKRVPVVRDSILVGIISRANLLRALASAARDIRPADTADSAIRATLLDELQKERWAPVGALDIIVRDGVVELWGTLTDERQREALMVAAQNVPGVKSVRDHLAWVDPMSAAVIYPPEQAVAADKTP